MILEPPKSSLTRYFATSRIRILECLQNYDILTEDDIGLPIILQWTGSRDGGRTRESGGLFRPPEAEARYKIICTMFNVSL